MKIVRAVSALTLLIASLQATAGEAISAPGHSALPTWVWVCAAGACVVFAAIVYSVIAFRPAVDSSSEMNTHRDTARELAWTVVPIAIVIAAAAPAMTNFTSGTHVPMSRDLQGCDGRRSCREYSLSQLINRGDHCDAVLANTRTTAVKTSPQIAAICSTRR